VNVCRHCEIKLNIVDCSIEEVKKAYLENPKSGVLPGKWLNHKDPISSVQDKISFVLQYNILSPSSAIEIEITYHTLTIYRSIYKVAISILAVIFANKEF
jgi:hypothetical protein